MNVLGINAYHGDSSACLVQDGKLVAAAEEERFSRIKHWAGFPAKSIQYCLQEAGIRFGNIDHVAVNSHPNANLLRKIGYTLWNRPDFTLVLDRIKNKKNRVGIKEKLLNIFQGEAFKGKVHFIEHHFSHLASAHLVSPFGESVGVSVDGFGDFSSAAWGYCRESNINIDHRVFFPHSLGIFYQGLTQFLGFPNYGDEYKLMGLAPYGKPAYLSHMHEVIRINSDGTFELNLKFFRHHKEKIEYEWAGGAPMVGNLFNGSELEKLIGFKPRGKGETLEQYHRDLANSVQARYEEVFFSLLESAHAEYRINQLTLAGGCAMNSVANGKIVRHSPFREVYIQPAAGDAGGAIGAAFTVWQKLGGTRNFVMNHAYWGPKYSSEDIEKLLDTNGKRLREQNCHQIFIGEEEELCQRTAKAISEGKVVGWFQGRMEWGPRALGNRSILGDPRRTDMKDILNMKIKRRESFRPFAPSILREAVPEWFETDGDVPFMMQVMQIREEKMANIPAVTHVDGSGRLQTVSRQSNPLYYRLIEKFCELTGVPMLLNTSFNENEPVVCRPEEGLECFLRTNMDVLVLGNYFITRSE